jgi:hypothetical protein
MRCAHTIRQCKPGSLHQFVETVGPPKDAEPGNWVRFHVLSSLSDEHAVSRMADGAAH